MTATTPHRVPRSVVAAAVVIVTAVVAAVVLTIVSPPGRQTTTAPTTSAPASPASPAAPSGSPPAPPGLTDGIYEVGTEIPAGTYTTSVPAAKPYGCYWARLRSFGRTDSIIDERNLEPGESARVVVKASDRGFKVSNGCTWQRQDALL